MMRVPLETSSARRRLRRLLLLLTSVVVGIVLLELSMRVLLFSKIGGETGLGKRLRQAQLYAPKQSREYWKLYTVFSGAGTKHAHGCFDWRFGWRTEDIDPATLAHVDEPLLGDRTPILLFGDSYAHCLESSRVCWEDLLETSELSRGYCLLNYGVGGFGVDQAYLMMHAVLARFRHKHPIVILGILVEDDLDRSYLPLRRTPKPSFVIEGEELTLRPVEQPSPREFLEANPVGITSYFWRLCLYGTRLLPRDVVATLASERAELQEKAAINRGILGLVAQEFAGLDGRGFVALFHGESALTSAGPYGWQEPFLYRTLEELGLPFVSCKRYLRAYLRQSGRKAKSLYYHDPASANHYTDDGNAIVFSALLDGLKGNFEPYAYLPER
jgi:hypothetical protein